MNATDIDMGKDDPHYLYDASSVSHDRRMASWQKYFSYFWGPSSVIPRSETVFDASVKSHRIGRLRLNNILLRGQQIKRKPGYSELLDGSFHALNIVHKGEGTLTRPCGKKTTVRAGEVLFSSSPQGNVFSVPGEIVSTQLMIPTKLLSNYIPNTPDVILFHEKASSVKMSLMGSMLDQLTETCGAKEVDLITATLIEKQMLELLALSVEMKECIATSDESSVRCGHRLRIQRIIQNYISDPNLNPGSIAALCGLSESYLYRIFNASDQSLMQTVKQLRLEKARDLLISDGTPKLSMGEVAYQCGFSSHSAFSRSFHRHFGISPKDMRSAL